MSKRNIILNNFNVLDHVKRATSHVKDHIRGGVCVLWMLLVYCCFWLRIHARFGFLAGIKYAMFKAQPFINFFSGYFAIQYWIVALYFFQEIDKKVSCLTYYIKYESKGKNTSQFLLITILLHETLLNQTWAMFVFLWTFFSNDKKNLCIRKPPLIFHII